MRSVILGLVVAGLVSVASYGQQRVSLAVETCQIQPGENAELRDALGALVDHIAANPEDLPGNIYGAFQEVTAEGSTFSFALEVDGLGEFEDFILARAEANRADEQRGALFRAVRSHLDLESCSWSFHLRLNPS